MAMYLVLSVFTSSAISLLATIKAAAFSIQVAANACFSSGPRHFPIYIHHNSTLAVEANKLYN
jgi:hypothetical protein